MFTLHIQKNVHKKFKNCPKWPKSENGLKLVYVRKHPFFFTKRLVTFMIDSFTTKMS